MLGSAFIYIGAAADKTNLEIPFPTQGGATFDHSINIKTRENANGRIVGQIAGRPKITQTVTWSEIDSTKWYEIGRYFEENSPFCFIRYFSHVLGRWCCEEFVVSSFSCDPEYVNTDGTGKIYENATFTITSTGANENV